MNTRDKLKLLKQIEARNAQRLKAWKDRRKQEARKADRKTTEKEKGP